MPAEADRPLVAVLRGLPRVRGTLDRALFARAERHGVAGVIHDACRREGVALPADLAAELDARAVARQLDHEAHLAFLRRVDAALARADVRAVILKGPLFAERYYPSPSSRGTTDIDVLVEEHALERAQAALRELGYTPSSDEAHDAWSRREHHHVVMGHAHALPLELHFHAYRGFGEKLPSEPLVSRAKPAGFAALHVLSPEDELVYLAVHAAAHRFGRLSWLYDMSLLLATMSGDQIAVAVDRARAYGYGRALALAGVLLTDVLGVDATSLGHLGAIREPLVRAVVGEPTAPLLRSATRFAYTTMLSDSLPAAVRYARASCTDHARRLLGLGR